MAIMTFFDKIMLMSNSIKDDKTIRIEKIYNSMIITSVLMIISSTITAIGLRIWLSNFTVTQFTSEAQRTAYSIGAWMGVIGGIVTIILALISLILLVIRIVLNKRFKNPSSSVKSIISIILFIITWLPLFIIFLIELFRSL